MPVGCADQEARLALAIVAPGFELLREFHRGQAFAALIKGDGHAVGRERRNCAAAIRKLGYLGRPGNPFQIAVNQFGFGSAADLSRATM